MLSRTPSRYSWIVTDVDVRAARAGCLQGADGGEKSLKGHQEEVAEVGEKGAKVQKVIVGTEHNFEICQVLLKVVVCTNDTMCLDDRPSREL
jgi:hypothetical protein